MFTFTQGQSYCLVRKKDSCIILNLLFWKHMNGSKEKLKVILKLQRTFT